jgi:hypothetical protein
MTRLASDSNTRLLWWVVAFLIAVGMFLTAVLLIKNREAGSPWSPIRGWQISADASSARGGAGWTVLAARWGSAGRPGPR